MWWLSIPLAKNKSPKHLWIWRKHEQGPTPRLLSPSAEFCLSLGWAQDTHFFLCLCSSVPCQEEMSLCCCTNLARSECSASWMRERCHRCCTVLWGKLISLFHYLLISCSKKEWSNLLGLILFLLWPFQSAWATKGLKPKEKFDLELLDASLLHLWRKESEGLTSTVQ